MLGIYIVKSFILLLYDDINELLFFILPESLFLVAMSSIRSQYTIWLFICFILRRFDLSIWMKSLKIADLTISNKESFDTFMRLAKFSSGQLDSLDKNGLPITWPIEVHIFIAFIHVTN